MDKRVQKSRQLIMSTFIELMSEKKFEKITINDIADRANINRGTVYLHYTDKYDLLDKCIKTYIHQLVDYCNSAGSNSPDIHAVKSTFDYLQANIKQYQILLTNEGKGYFRNALYNQLSDKTLKLVTLSDESNSVTDAITMHFFTSAVVGVIEWWIINSMPCSADDVSKHLLALVSSGMKL